MENVRTEDQARQKQEGDEATTGARRDGYSAEELGAASIYDDQTQLAQQMNRGDESQGDPNSRDTVGATDFKDWEDGRRDRDTIEHAGAAGDTRGGEDVGKSG